MTSDSTLFIANQDSAILRDNEIRPMITPNEPLDPGQLRQVTRRRLICHPLQVDGRAYQLRGQLRKPRLPMVPAPASTPS